MRSDRISSDRKFSIPDWVWFLVAAIGVLIFGFVADRNYAPDAVTKPSEIAMVIAGFFVYLFPGWRLSRYVQKRASNPKMGEYFGLAVLMAWIGVAWLVTKIISG